DHRLAAFDLVTFPDENGLYDTCARRLHRFHVAFRNQRAARFDDHIDLTQRGPEKCHHHETDDDVNQTTRCPPGHSGNHVGDFRSSVRCLRRYKWPAQCREIDALSRGRIPHWRGDAHWLSIGCVECADCTTRRADLSGLGRPAQEIVIPTRQSRKPGLLLYW